jgi:3alpha(or 20beta)-hydroxysteroid dehydrogenase
MGRLDGRVPIITGARALSVAPAAKFSDEGAKVLLVDIEERALRGAVEAIGRIMAAQYVCWDVTSDDDTQRYVRTKLDYCTKYH